MQNINTLSSYNNTRKISFKNLTEKIKLEEEFRQAKLQYLRAQRNNSITPAIEQTYTTSLEELLKYYEKHNCLKDVLALKLPALKISPSVAQVARENALEIMYLSLNNNYNPEKCSVFTFINSIFTQRIIDDLRSIYGRKNTRKLLLYTNTQNYSNLDERKIQNSQKYQTPIRYTEAAQKSFAAEKEEELRAIFKKFLFSEKDIDILVLRFGPQGKTMDEIAALKGCAQSNISLIIKAYIKEIKQVCENSPELLKRILEYCNWR